MNIAEKLTTVAENQQKVYDAGKKAEHDAFWRRFTHNGERKSYYSAFFRTDFSGETIPEGLCKPQRQDATFAAMDRMFYQYRGTTLPKGIDATLAANNDSVGGQLFISSPYLTEIYDMRIPASSSMTSWYAYCSSLHTIEKIRVNENTTFQSTFISTSKLKNVTFEGVIGKSISFSVSPLSISSIKNVIKHLKKISDSTTNVVNFKNEGSFSELEKAGFTEEDYLWIEEELKYSKDELISMGWHDWASIVSLLGWEFVLS